MTPTCNSCDQITDDLDAAGYCPECRAAARANAAERCTACGHPIPDPATTAQAMEHEAPCTRCDALAQHGTYAPCATVEHSPWDADDDAELDRISWSHAIRGGRARRSVAIDAARLTWSELATAAARFGIVADPDALPMTALHRHPTAEAEAVERQRETGDVRDNAERHYRNRHIVETLRATGSRTVPEWAADILAGYALPFPESRQRGDQDHAESHPSRFASWPIIQAAR